MYSGQAKGENQSLTFDIIETNDGKLIDWRFSLYRIKKILKNTIIL